MNIYEVSQYFLHIHVLIYSSGAKKLELNRDNRY